MKKLIILVLCFMVIMSMAACGSTNNSSSGSDSSQTTGTTDTDKVYNVIVSTGDSAPVSITVLNQFADSVRTKTNGQLNLSFVELGTIISYGDGMKSLMDGTVSVGWYPGIVFINEIPLTILEGGTCSAIRTYDEIQTLYYEKGFADLLKENYNEIGVEWIEVWPHHAESIVSVKPINSISDLKGLKLRGASIISETFGALGAGTVSVPPPEIYTMLSTKAIDGAAFSSPIDNYDMGFAEVTSYWQATPGLNEGFTMFLAANKDFWDGLPEDLRTVFCEEAKIYGEVFYNAKESGDKEAVVSAQEAGIEFFSWSDEDMRTWTNTAFQILEEKYITDDATQKGFDIVKEYAKGLGRID